MLPTRYSYDFMNTRLPYEYNTINICDYSDEELEGSMNPFAWVLLIAKQALLHGKDRERRWLEKKVFVFRKLYERDLFRQKKMQVILDFMERYIPFRDREINRIFEEQIDLITGKKNTMDYFELVAEMDRQEGFRRGVKKTNEKAVRALLTNTKFSIEKIASIMGVSVAMVNRIKKSLAAK